MGTTGPGSRPRVLETAFSGGLARTRAGLQEAGRRVTLRPALTLGSRGAAAAAISSDTQRSGESSSPDELEGGRRAWPVTRKPRCSLRVGLCGAPPRGAVDSTCHKGPRSCGRAAHRSSSRASLPYEDGAHPAARAELGRARGGGVAGARESPGAFPARVLDEGSLSDNAVRLQSGRQRSRVPRPHWSPWGGPGPWGRTKRWAARGQRAEELLCAGQRARCTQHLISPSLRKLLLLSPGHRGGRGGLEKSTHLLKVTQVVGGRARLLCNSRACALAEVLERSGLS